MCKLAVKSNELCDFLSILGIPHISSRFLILAPFPKRLFSNWQMATSAHFSSCPCIATHDGSFSVLFWTSDLFFADRRGTWWPLRSSRLRETLAFFINTSFYIKNERPWFPWRDSLDYVFADRRGTWCHLGSSRLRQTLIMFLSISFYIT